MFTSDPQPALNFHLSSADRPVVKAAEARWDTPTITSHDLTSAELDDLLGDLPEDFNGILVY